MASYLILRRCYGRLDRPVGQRLLRRFLHGLLCGFLLGRLLVRLRAGLGLGLRACRDLRGGGEPGQHVLAVRANTQCTCDTLSAGTSFIWSMVLRALRDDPSILISSFAARIMSMSVG